MKFFRAIIKILCVVLAVSLALAAAFFRKNGVDVVALKSGDDIRAESVIADASDSQYERIAESGYLRMYFDSSTTAIIIRDTVDGKKWYAMPNGSDASMVSMTVAAADGMHILNSQTNSVAFSEYKYKIKDDGVKVTYTMTDTPGSGKSGIAYSVTVNYTLKDGNFFVDAKTESVGENTDCAVTDFSVLEYFGAFESAGENDFLLIPDGCGALAFPYYESGQSEYSCRVYGDDYGVENKKSNRALIGAFGIKNGDSAYAAIIDSAQELAEIKAVSSKDGFSRISAHFAIDYVKTEGNSLYCFKNKSASVSICYKFLSKGNATYSDIASACREQLIRNGTFSTASISSYDDVPVTLNLTGAYKKNRRKFKYEEYTTFSQATDIIKRIKAKGISNLSVRYSGIFESGSTDIIAGLGGKSGLRELASYAKSQNTDLLPELNVLTYESVLGRFNFSEARAMNKYSFSIGIKNEINDEVKSYHLRTLKKANEFIDSVISKTDDYGISGYCINDSGKILVSDFSKSGAKRTDYRLGILSQLSAVSGVGKIMVDSGNVYTVKSAASIADIPMSVSYKEGKQYNKIPFVQSVIHGMTVLFSPAINTEENPEEAALRCIEYGVCPSFSVVYKKPDGCKKNILFDDAVNGIVETYTGIATALGSLEGERITGHTQIKNGVFCTTYSNSAKIYVNYNTESVSANGVSIPAESYIRID